MSTKPATHDGKPEAPISSAVGALMLVTGALANDGSCVARHEGRVVFVRYVCSVNEYGCEAPLTAALNIGTQKLSR